MNKRTEFERDPDSDKGKKTIDFTPLTKALWAERGVRLAAISLEAFKISVFIVFGYCAGYVSGWGDGNREPHVSKVEFSKMMQQLDQNLGKHLHGQGN